jgi:hypothetical protein
MECHIDPFGELEDAVRGADAVKVAGTQLTVERNGNRIGSIPCHPGSRRPATHL